MYGGQQGNRENSEAPGQEADEPPQEKGAENFQGLEINFETVLLAYIMSHSRP